MNAVLGRRNMPMKIIVPACEVNGDYFLKSRGTEYIFFIILNS